MSALSPRGKKGADEVLRVFDSLLANAVRPNTITYVSVIRAWGDKGDWQQAEKVRCRSRQQVHEGDILPCMQSCLLRYALGHNIE